MRAIKSYHQFMRSSDGECISEWIAVGVSILNKEYRASSDNREDAIAEVQKCIDDDLRQWNGKDRRKNRQL